MERQRSDNGRRNRQPKAKDSSQCRIQRASSLPPIARAPPPPANELKLAAIAINLNVRLRSADMPLTMQERAIRRARALVDANQDKNKRPNPTQLAMCLKKEFDALYGPAWHCIVGKSFGSFVTHASGGFLYFSVDKLCFLLFKTEVQPVVKPPTLPRLKISNA
ncbi:Dynein light chain [Theobroma cacao]|nr:Dynein light chain [Theobroma cacao]